MKKRLIFLILFITILFVYYFKSEYEIKYTINNYKVIETYKNNKYYFEINGKHFYNMDSYTKRKFRKKQILSIKTIKDQDNECLILKTKSIKSVPLCYENNNLIHFSLVTNESLKTKLSKYLNNEQEESSKDFYYYNNLEKNEYVGIWKYNGYYLMNNKGIKTINLFKNDRYSNDLSFGIKDKIICPNYDQIHEFNSFYIIDIKSGSYKKIENDNEISYDSKIVGQNKNKIYLFDYKYKKEYSIDYKKEKIQLVGDSDKGFIAFSSNKEKKVLVSYFNDKSFNINKEYNYYYTTTDVLKKSYKENKVHSTIIFNNKAELISGYNDVLYFINDEYLYRFDSINGNKKIVKNYEWNFNKENTVFIYKK